MDDETKRRIAEIKERVEGTSVDAWRFVTRSSGDRIYGGRNQDDPTPIVVSDRYFPIDENDGKFIANARQDVPFLLDALEKAHAEIVNLKVEINQMREDEGFPPPYEVSPVGC